MTKIATKEALMEYLNSATPEEVLTDLSGGKSPSKSELDIIEHIKEFKLPDEVINVLIQYVLLKTDMKLTRRYMEKIASHWARKKIKTVEQAMEIAKKEHKQYLEWKEKKSESPKKQLEEFNKFDIRYMDKLWTKYGMESPISMEIIFYTKRVNHGLLIYWFTDRVAEFINTHKPVDVKNTQELLEVFHQKYVVPFGKNQV
jgi:DnaD/phage-associated family protein